jgi:acyl transferase domain-containing protein
MASEYLSLHFISFQGSTISEIEAGVSEILNSKEDIKYRHIHLKGNFRFAAVYNSRDELKQLWELWKIKPTEIRFKPQPIVFLYSGQGSQYPRMGKTLIENIPTFRDDLLEILSLSEATNGKNLYQILLSGEAEQLDRIDHTSQILFAFEVSLTNLWSRWGVKPDAVIGHSLGEYAAAYAAGVFSLDDGVRLIAERGHLMLQYANQNIGNSLYTVIKEDFCEVAEMVELHKENISIAGVNSPEIATISGNKSDVEAIVNKLQSLGVKVKKLPVAVPGHSTLLKPIAEKFKIFCDKYSFNQPKISWYSTLTGQNMRKSSPVDSVYWSEQIVEPVRLWATIYSVEELGSCTFLEIGPGDTLSKMACAASVNDSHRWVTTLSPKDQSKRHVIETAINLWHGGFELDLDIITNDLSI